MNVKPPAEIVIADDQPAVREHYAVVFRHWFPHVRIHAFGDGQDAWDHLLRTDPDLLVMDLSRPGMDGLQTLHGLAARNATYPILVISASYNDKMQRLTEKAAGTLRVRFLSKPTRLEQIQHALIELLPPL